MVATVGCPRFFGKADIWQQYSMGPPLGMLLLFLYVMSVLALALEPLGAHRNPSEDLTILHGFPAMTDFFLEYVRLHRPLLIRDAVPHWSVFDFWADARIIDTDAAEAKVDM